MAEKFSNRSLTPFSRHYATAQAGTAEKTIDWTHNANGQVTGYSDTTTSATYQYDDNGQMVSENVNYGTFALTNSYSYDGNGRVKTYTDPQGIVYTYSYDADGRMTSVNIPGEGQIAFGEFKEGRYTRKLLPGNQEQMVVLDGRLRPIDLKSLRFNDQNPFHQIGYQYNDINRMEARSINTLEKAFAYSVKDELTEVVSGQLTVGSYEYDLNGNRLVSTTTNNQIPATKNYSYDDNGRVTSDGTFTYTYDGEGNLTAKTSATETWEYLYNVEGRIIEIKKDNVTVATYQYDPMGRRISKTVLGSAPVPGAGEGVPPEPVPVTTYYHYNQFGLCGEYNASGNLLKSYGYAPGSGWSTDPLFMKVAPSSISDIQSPIFYFFHNDALGTPQALTDKAGTIMWTASYDEFGSATISGNGGTSSTSSVECNLRFPGQYFDAETGLHYNFHRYYDPMLGRYITEDPIRDGLNWYAYAGSNPGNAIDPDGLEERRDQYGFYDADPYKLVGNAIKSDIKNLINSITSARKKGHLVNIKFEPISAEDLINEIRNSGYTHIIVSAHGTKEGNVVLRDIEIRMSYLKKLAKHHNVEIDFESCYSDKYKGKVPDIASLNQIIKFLESLPDNPRDKKSILLVSGPRYKLRR